MGKGLEWGRDFCIVISTDAVHYGDKEWGGKNYAPYGTDSAGYAKADGMMFRSGCRQLMN